MERKVRPNIAVQTEKITNEPFDDIIGHSDCERKYFTIENNDTIYKRIKTELSIVYLPYLGACVDFGVGDICLEEAKDCFKFYIIDRIAKFEYEEFNNIEDAIQKLISYYRENELVNDANKMEEIFYKTLDLKNQKKETTNEEHPKILKPKKIN